MLTSYDAYLTRNNLEDLGSTEQSYFFFKTFGGGGNNGSHQSNIMEMVSCKEKMGTFFVLMFDV